MEIGDTGCTTLVFKPTLLNKSFVIVVRNMVQRIVDMMICHSSMLRYVIRADPAISLVKKCAEVLPFIAL